MSANNALTVRNDRRAGGTTRPGFGRSFSEGQEFPRGR